MNHRLTRMRAGRMIWMAPICIGFFTIGCGGAGGPGANSTGSAQTSKIGPAEVSYIGRPQTSVTGVTGQISTVGQAGASYSNLTIDPTPNLSSTYLAFSRIMSAGGEQIYTAPTSGNGGQSLLVHSSDSAYPSWSQTGTIAFLTITSNEYQFETVQSDGSQLKTVASNIAGTPTIAPNGSFLVYSDGGNLYTIPISGGAAKEIYSLGNANNQVVISPNSTQIAFSAKNPTTSTNNVYTMAVAGGAATNVTPAAYTAGNVAVSCWSPDGTTLACTYQKLAVLPSTITVSLNGGDTNYLTPSGFEDTTPCISPDNSKIAFYRYNAGGAIPGIYIADFGGSNPQLVLPDPSGSGTTGPIQSLCWSPFQQDQKFVGTGGTLSTANVSGFLMSQNGSQFASLLTFAATTPGKATIASPPVSSSGAPMIYTLGADSITNISYTNSFNGAHVSLPLTTTPTAIVSIDGGTGQVDLVAAAAVLKGSASQARTSGSVVTYTGQFTAIYDGTGKNVAPFGATNIQIDRSTGKLVSFR